MIHIKENILQKIATMYYPSGISVVNDYERYCDSNEIKELDALIEEEFNSDFVIEFKEDFKNTIEKDLRFDLIDTTYESVDKSLSFEININKENELHKICINISLLIPYYFTYCLKVDIDPSSSNWISLPVRDFDLEKKQYKENLESINEFLEKHLMFNRFDEALLKKIVPNISLGDLDINEVNFYEAFFKQDSYL